jgi:hypothetical protein
MIIAAIIVLVEVIVRLLPVYEYADPQEYYLHRKGVELREGIENYRVILLGDSRSMALRPPEAGLSFYNFSAPGMGNRYYTVLLKRYLSTGRKPDLILLAPHQHFLLAPPERPVTDLRYDDGAAPLQAASQFFIRRLDDPLFQSKPVGPQPALRPELFAQLFRNGRLHFLGYIDSIRIFSGMDRLVQAYEGAPYLYRTYFLRTTILGMVQNPGRDGNIEGCDSCDAIYRGICYGRLQLRDRTALVEHSIRNFGGAFNLDDLTSPGSRLGLIVTRNTAIKGMADGLNTENMTVQTDTLEELVDFASSQGIKIVFLELPLPERVSQARQVPLMRQTIQGVLSRYEGTGYVQFPTLSYPETRYIDPLHLSCYGAAELNNDFRRIFPAIRKGFLEQRR